MLTRQDKSMGKRKNRPILDPDTAIHICTISAGMVGVCLTTIGLIRVAITMQKVNTYADDILALDAVIFLVATLTSYCVLRVRSQKRLYLLERIADVAFMTGISVMTVACIFIVYIMSLN